jgi:hypothetical protein
MLNDRELGISRYVAGLASRFQTLFFVHVPKTAGTYLMSVALRDVLKLSQPAWRARLRRFAAAIRGVRSEPRRGTVFWSPHPVCTARPLAIPSYHRAWTRTCRADPELATSLVFAVVRNPFDLLLSMYAYGFPYRRPRPEKPKPALDAFGFPFASFAEFVQAYCNRQYPWIIEHHHRFLFFQLFDDDGVCVPHVLLRTEHLDEGLRRLLAPFGVTPLASPDRVNAAAARETDYREHYTEDLRRLVEDKCGRELEAFGYSFDGDDGRVLIDPRDVTYNPHTDRMTLWRARRSDTPAGYHA